MKVVRQEAHSPSMSGHGVAELVDLSDPLPSECYIVSTGATPRICSFSISLRSIPHDAAHALHSTMEEGRTTIALYTGNIMLSQRALVLKNSEWAKELWQSYEGEGSRGEARVGGGWTGDKAREDHGGTQHAERAAAQQGPQRDVQAAAAVPGRHKRGRTRQQKQPARHLRQSHTSTHLLTICSSQKQTAFQQTAGPSGNQGRRTNKKI